MADNIEYQTKLKDLQKYVPFLENTISKLKRETGQPREAQVSKLQSLLEILTDTKKKLKFDALRKCEEVILKLHEKVEKKSTVEGMHKFMCRTPPDADGDLDSNKTKVRNSPDIEDSIRFIDARNKLKQMELVTPASPSPPLDIPVMVPKPVVIPTEKVIPVVESRRNVNPFRNPMENADFTSDTWETNFSDVNKINLINSPMIYNTPLWQPEQWQPPDTMGWRNDTPLFQRRTDFGQLQNAPPNRYSIWSRPTFDDSRWKPIQSREVINYSDFSNFPSPTHSQIGDHNLQYQQRLGSPLIECNRIEKQITMPKNSPKKADIYSNNIIIDTSAKPKVKPSTLSKPPLTESDLKALLSPADTSSSNSPKLEDDMSIENLETLRKSLVEQLGTLPGDKLPVKPKPSGRSPIIIPSSAYAAKPKSPRVEKVIKESDNIFGNLLSSIDDKILEKQKIKKPEITKKESVKDGKIVKDSKDDKNVTKDIAKDTKKDIAKDGKRDEKRDIAKDIDKDIKHINKELAKHDKKDLSKVISKDAKIDVKKDSSKDLKVVSKDDKIDKEPVKRELIKIAFKTVPKVDKSRSIEKVNEAKHNKESEKKDRHKERSKDSGSKTSRESSATKDDKIRSKDDSKSKEKHVKHKERSSSESKKDETKSVRSSTESRDKKEEHRSKDRRESSKEKLKEVKRDHSRDKNKLTKDDIKNKNKEELLKHIPKDKSSSRDSSKEPKDRKVEDSKTKKDTNSKDKSKELLKDDKTKNKIDKTDKLPDKEKKSGQKIEKIKEDKTSVNDKIKDNLVVIDENLKKVVEIIKQKFNKPEINNTRILDFGKLDTSRHESSKLEVNRLDIRQEINRPEINKDDIFRHEINRSDMNRSDMNRSDINRSDKSRLDMSRSDMNRADMNRPDMNRPDMNRPDMSRHDMSRLDMSRPDVNRTDMNRSDVNRPDMNRSDINRYEMNTHEPSKSIFDNRIVNSGRISDKYPHKRKTSTDSVKSNDNKTFESNSHDNIPFISPPQPVPKPQDPRIRNNPIFNQNTNIQNKPFERSKLLLEFACDNSSVGYGMGNKTPGDPFLSPPQEQNYPRNFDFPGRNEQFRPNNQFSHNDPRLGSKQQEIWVRGDQGFPPAYQNQNRPRFNQNNQNFPFNNFPNHQEPIYNQYDLTQVGPIDYYEPFKEKNLDEGHKKSPLLDTPTFINKVTNILDATFTNKLNIPPLLDTHNFSSKGSYRGARWNNQNTYRGRGNYSRGGTDHRGYRGGYNRHIRDSFDKSDHYNKQPEEMEIGERNTKRNSIDDSNVNENKTNQNLQRKNDNLEIKPPQSNQKKCDTPESINTQKKVEEKPKDIEKVSKTEEISSPLTSLYDAESKKPVGKGYGIQNFKIPKIKRVVEEPKEESKASEDDEKKDEAEKPEINKEEQPESSKVEEIKIDEDDDNKQDIENVAPEVEIEKKSDKTETETDTKNNMVNKFIQSIVEQGNISMFYSVLEKLGESLPKLKYKRIRRIIESDSEDDEEGSIKDDKEDSSTSPEKEDKLNESFTSEEKPEDIKEEVTEKEPEEIVETVGERIKSRRRKKPEEKKEETKKPPKTKRRNALEMLQDDIREMFICEGVLTASGHRMCRILREQEEEFKKVEEVSPKKKPEITDDEDMPLVKRTKGKPGPKKKDDAQKEKLKATRSSPRVILEKTDVSKYKTSSPDLEESSDEEEQEVTKPTRPSRRKSRIESAETVILGTNTTSGRSPSVEKIQPPRLRSRSYKDSSKGIENDSDNASIASSSISEKTDILSPPKVKKMVKKIGGKKKKRSNWAMGVISKKKPKQKIENKTISEKSDVETTPEVHEDTESIAETEEVVSSDNEEFGLLQIDPVPDVNYYLDNRNKYDCKLCDYKGKFIVHHYRTRHPESENMIARLSPAVANLAIEESEKFNFEVVEPFEEDFKLKKDRPTFCCRFCSTQFKQEYTFNFFDHITCHTGEYRYCCEICNFRTGLRKALCTHYNNLHPNTKRPTVMNPISPPPLNFRFVFGYICKLCNFTQLTKTNVENHIKVSHPDKNVDIIKINMSSKLVPLPDENEKKEDEILEAEKEEITEKIVEEIEKPAKMPDLKVFLTSENIDNEDKRIEEERLKKMQEVCDKLKTPKRSALSFTDKLRDKLATANDEQEKNESENPEIEQPQISDDKENLKLITEIKTIDVAIPESEPKEPISKEENWLAIESTCSLAEDPDETINDVTKEVVEEEKIVEEPENFNVSDLDNSLPLDGKKKNVLSIIQRLAAKLQNPVELPTISDLGKTEISKKNIKHPLIIDIGAVRATVYTKNLVKYTCMVDECLFSTELKTEFTTHCLNNHPKVMSRCTSCNDRFLDLVGNFVHLTDVHCTTDVIKKFEQVRLEIAKIGVEKVGKNALFTVNDQVEITQDYIEGPFIKNVMSLNETEEPVRPLIKIRRLSGDLLSASKPVEVVLPPPPVEPVNDFGFNLQISDVKSLTLEEEQEIFLSQSKENATKVATNPTETKETDNQIKPSANMTALMSESSQSIKSGAKSSALMHVFKKKPEVFLKMLTPLKLRHLFKCPEETCSYTTNFSSNMLKHFKIHKADKVNYFCPYCNFLIPITQLITHISYRHSNCLYQCIYCFYRGNQACYVEIHEMECHPKRAIKVIELEPHPEYEIRQNGDDSLELKKVVLPFYCRQGPCYTTFLIVEEFMEHLLQSHINKKYTCYACQPGKVFYTVQGLIQHYITHKMGKYQCRFCLYASLYPDLMLNHYARAHPTHKPVAIIRQFKSIASTYNTQQDILEDLELVDLSSVNPHNTTNTIPIQQYLEMEGYHVETITAKVKEIKTKKILNASILSTALTANITNSVNQENEIETIDLIDDEETEIENTSSIEETEKDNNKEPLIILKHRSEEKRNEIVNAVDPLSIDLDTESNSELDNVEFVDNIVEKPQNVQEIIDKEPTTKRISPIIETVILDKEPTINKTVPKLLPTKEAVPKPLITNKETVPKPPIKETIPKPSIAIKETVSKPSIPIKETIVIEKAKIGNVTSIDDIKDTGLSGHELFRCGTTDCKFTAPIAQLFKEHLFTCDILKEGGYYNCVHCAKKFKYSAALIDHIRVHGTLRYGCSICEHRAPVEHIIIKHMRIKHKIQTCKMVPVNSLLTDSQMDLFIAVPSYNRGKKTFKEGTRDIQEDTGEKVAYEPDEIDWLPRPAIYSQEIKCARCGYSTKVRMNLLRHLQAHLNDAPVAETAPVNPVPCLEKNEKMFDKMLNLANSSFSSTRMGGKNERSSSKEEELPLPAFVPVSKRYVCGADGCNYLTHDDSMLKHHFTALHTDETTYRCPHCNILLLNEKGEVTIENIIFHLRMHDLHLFKCSHCQYMHYQKSKVEKHLLDKHPDRVPYIHIIRELENTANDSDERTSEPLETTKEPKDDKPWKCGFCRHRAQTEKDVQNHVSQTHGVKSQYKCSLCSFKCENSSNFGEHVKIAHPHTEVTLVPVYFRIDGAATEKTITTNNVETESFDTTPLWRRDTTKVKNIRGILIEETRSPKRTPKGQESAVKAMDSVKNVENVTKNLFEDIDGKTTLKMEGKDNVSDMIKSFGAFGNPVGNKFACPFCKEFQTVFKRKFVSHICKELKYNKYKCGTCDFKAHDYSTVTTHSLDQHSKELKPNVRPLTPDALKERWVDKVLLFQTREIKKYQTNQEITSESNSDSLDTILIKDEEKEEVIEEEKEVVEKKIKLSPKGVVRKLHKCDLCKFETTNIKNLRKHMIQHKKPYRCNLCTYRGQKVASLKMHFGAKHPNTKADYTHVFDADKSSCNLKRKREEQESEEDVSPSKVPSIETTSEEVDVPETAILPDPIDLEPVEPKNITYLCLHCNKKFYNLDELRVHFVQDHEGPKLKSMKYKIIESHQKESSVLNYMYKCKYCEFNGTLDTVKRHHLEKHPGKKYVNEIVSDYKCTICTQTYKKYQSLKKHFTAHKNEVFKYELVQSVVGEDPVIDLIHVMEEPSFGLNMLPTLYKCTYCEELPFKDEDCLRNHHNLLHSHLNIKILDLKKYKCPVENCGHMSNILGTIREHLRSHTKPIKCLYCPSEFTYPSLLNGHHLKEHPNEEYYYQTDQDAIQLTKELRDNLLVLGDDGKYEKIKAKSTLGKRQAIEPLMHTDVKYIAIDSSFGDASGSKPVKKVVNVARKSTSSPPFNNKVQVARKSTTMIKKRTRAVSGFSFYGTKAVDLNDYKNVTTEANIQGNMVRVNVIGLQHILKLFPRVVVKDIKKFT